MKKLNLICCAAAMLVAGLFTTARAQSALIEQDMATAVGIGDPARQGSTDIDAVIYNPAGTAFLKDGFSVSLNGTAKLWHVNTSVNGTNNGEINSKSILPSIQLAYKFKKWTISGSFASEGGYGNRKYTNNSPVLFNSFAARQLISQNPLISDVKDDISVGFGVGDQTGIGTQFLNSHLYDFNIRIGLAYQISNKLSAYVGCKIADVSYKLYFNHAYKVYQYQSNKVLESNEYFQGIENNVNALPAGETKEQLQKFLSNVKISEEVANLSKFDMSHSGWGAAPILGFDVKLKDVNFGIKYEFPVYIKSELKNSGLFSIVGLFETGSYYLPSMLSFGADCKIYKFFSLGVGSYIVFKTPGKSLIESQNGVVYTFSLAPRFDLSKKLSINVGCRLSSPKDQYISTVDDLLGNLNIEPQLKKYWYQQYSCGLKYKIIDNLKVNIGFAIANIPVTELNEIITTKMSVYSPEDDSKMEEVDIFSKGLYQTKPAFKFGVGVSYCF